MAGMVAAPMARAAGSDPRLMRNIRILPMDLPAGPGYARVRLVCDLVVRDGRDVLADVALVEAMRPRIIGRLVEGLAQRVDVDKGSGAPELRILKARILEIANTAIGRPLIEDVLIISLLVT